MSEAAHEFSRAGGIEEEREEMDGIGGIMDYCEYYYYQKDQFDEVVIEYCAHPKNPQHHDGNCHQVICPKIREHMKYGECGGLILIRT